MADGKPGNGSHPREEPEQRKPTIEYPTSYIFKIMGLASEDFEAHAIALVERALGRERMPDISTRATIVGKYQSISLSVVLHSEEQRKAVYQVLWEDERVVYYL